MFPSVRHEHEHRQDVHNSDEETHSASRSAFSATGMSASASLTDSNRDIASGSHQHQPLPPLFQATTRDSSTPTPSPRTIGTTQMDSGTSTSGANTMEAGGNGGSLGVGLGTPLPPPPPHAQPTHTQPAPLIMPHIIESESPTSLASSGTPAPPPPPSFPSQPPSPPFPSPPPPPRAPPQHPRLGRTNMGTIAPGRSLSFLAAPSRSPSARTNIGQGTGYGTGNGNGFQRDRDRERGSITTSMEKAGILLEDPADFSAHVFDLSGSGLGRNGDRDRDSRYRDNGIGMRGSMPVPVLMPDGREREREWVMGENGQRTRGGIRDGVGGGGGGGSGGMRMDGDSDSIGIPRLPRTVHERLQPTIDHAMAEEVKYARKAKLTGYALNTAIGLQVFLSALITALSAVTSGRRTQIMTSILGGAGTVVASYLARARGSNEPELSIARTKDLQRFVRTCDAFVQDHGLETGFEDGDGKEGDMQRAHELDERIRRLRNELEHLLGNGDGERRLAPPV